MLRSWSLPAAFAAAFVLARALPAADTYEIDAVHSTVLFRIQHMGTSYSYGRFNEISGKLVLDAQDPTKTQVEAEIKTESIDTANKKRDEHLLGPDFFSAKQFPKISFKSTSAKRDGEHGLEIKGNLTLHGVTKEVTIRAAHVGSGKVFQGEALVGYEGVFTIKRSDFGMGNMVGPIGDEVRITVSLEAAKKG